MTTVHTNRESVERLYTEAARVQPDKAALAAMIGEAFLNGMAAQQQLDKPTQA